MSGPKRKKVSRDTFEFWLMDMDDALDRFLGYLPREVRNRLNFSPDSLSVLEEWILHRYASKDQMLPATEAQTVDGLARYIGETFRRAVGGKWNIILDDPQDAFYQKPILQGYPGQEVAVCPLLLATACADRRTGRFLAGVLASAIGEARAAKGESA